MTKPIRAISIPQPYATLVALGAKRFVVHPWSINYNGLFAIHAESRWGTLNDDLCRSPYVKIVLKSHGYDRPSKLPKGVVTCVTELIECNPIVDQDYFKHLNFVESCDEEVTNFRVGHWCYTIGSVYDCSPVPCSPEKPIWKLNHQDTIALTNSLGSEKIPWSGIDFR